MRAFVHRSIVVSLLAIVIASLLTVGAAQALLVKMSPQKMTRLSQKVLVADVATVTPRHIATAGGSDWGTIETVVRLRVSNELKGRSQRWITLRIPGGTADGRTLVVEDTAQFYPGERVLLFLDKHGVVGWRQGALEVVDGQVEAWGMSLRAAKRTVSGESTAAAVLGRKRGNRRRYSRLRR